MKTITIKDFVERNNVYVKVEGSEESCPLNVKKIVRADQILLEISLSIGGKKYSREVAVENLHRTKFLRGLPIVIDDEECFYKELIKKIQELEFGKEDTEYYIGKNGIQKINDEWVLVLENIGITENGFEVNIYSGIPGAYIPPAVFELVNKSKEIVKNLLHTYNRNPEVFYPLFLLNFMAISSKYFRNIGEKEFMKITIWLDGCSGSGKTELAKAVCSYAYEDEDLNCNLVSVTGKRKYVMSKLFESSGKVFILDDVKKEAVRERRNSVDNIVDDSLRSIFQGKMTDVLDKQEMQQQIDTCALITGEYMKTEESQNARLLYLKVDGFLKNKKNSETLRTLQKNPMWLTSTCCGYAQWLLGKMEDDSFRQVIVDKLEELRSNPKEYGDIGNAERLNENKHMLEMVCFMAEMYFSHIGLTREFIEKFHNYAMLSIEEITNNTFALLGGEQMIIQKAMKKVLETSKIRKARFQNNLQYTDCGCTYRQDYFMLQKDDDFLYIDDYDESMLRNTSNQHVQYNNKPYVLIREEKLMNLLQEEIREMLKGYPIPSITGEKILMHLPKILKKTQMIYNRYRSDGNWGRTAVKYPVCEIYIEDSQFYNGTDRLQHMVGIVDFKPVIQMNTEHSCMDILFERVEDSEIETILPDIDVVYDTNKQKMNEERIYKIRKSFMNGKTLYKE